MQRVVLMGLVLLLSMPFDFTPPVTTLAEDDGIISSDALGDLDAGSSQEIDASGTGHKHKREPDGAALQQPHLQPTGISPTTLFRKTLVGILARRE